MSRTKMAKRRQLYTTRRRTKILATVKTKGVAEAAREHGVPQTTISNWLNRDAAKVVKEAPSASPKRVVAKSYTPSEKDAGWAGAVSGGGGLPAPEGRGEEPQPPL